MVTRFEGVVGRSGDCDGGVVGHGRGTVGCSGVCWGLLWGVVETWWGVVGRGGGAVEVRWGAQ